MMKGGTTVKKEVRTLQKILGRPIKCIYKANIFFSKLRLTLRDCSGEGLLLHGREMVLGSPSDGDSELSEAKSSSDQGSPHFKMYLWIL